MAASSVTLTTAQSQPDPLTGRWRSTDISPSGVRAVFEFHGGDQLDSYSAAIAEEKYRLVGTDTILLQSGKGQEMRELEWDSQDQARIENETIGQITRLARVGKALDSKLPLTGEWNTILEWNGKSYPARALFSSDGKVVWITTLRPAEHGRYSVQNGNIRLEIPGRPVVEGSFAITDGRLTLPSPKGGGSTFERF
jgi:hypothetical protein